MTTNNFQELRFDSVNLGMNLLHDIKHGVIERIPVLATAIMTIWNQSVPMHIYDYEQDMM